LSQIVNGCNVGCKRLKVAQVRSCGNRIRAGIEPVRDLIANW
jgi:hypothetical protein